MRHGPPLSTLLPREVAQALRAALQIDPKAPRGESLARTAAIEMIVERARRQYPHLFK